MTRRSLLSLFAALIGVSAFAARAVQAQLPPPPPTPPSACARNDRRCGATTSTSTTTVTTTVAETAIGLAKEGMWRGEVHVFSPAGFEIEPINGVLYFPLNAHVTTGPGGHLQILLRDETVFTLSAGSDMILDDFVYDPNTGAGKFAATVIHGLFRFVTGRLAPHTPDNFKIKIPIGFTGPRGTDFAIEVQPGGAGAIRVYSGLVELTLYDTGDVIEVTANAMLSFDENGRTTGPVPLRREEVPKVPAPDEEAS